MIFIVGGFSSLRTNANRNMSGIIQPNFNGPHQPKGYVIADNGDLIDDDIIVMPRLAEAQEANGRVREELRLARIEADGLAGRAQKAETALAECRTTSTQMRDAGEKLLREFNDNRDALARQKETVAGVLENTARDRDEWLAHKDRLVAELAALRAAGTPPNNERVRVIEAELAAMTQHRDEWQAYGLEAREERNALRAELAELRAAGVAQDDERVVRLVEHLRAANEQIEQMQAGGLAIEAERDAAQATGAALEQEIAQLRQRLQRKRNFNSKAELDAAKRQLARFEQQRAHEQRRRVAHLLARTKEARLRELEPYQAHIARLTEEKLKVEATARELQAAVLAERNDYVTQNNLLQDAKRHLAQLRDEAATHAAQVERHERENAERLHQLQAVVAEGQVSDDELRRLQAEDAEVRARIEAQKRELAALRASEQALPVPRERGPHVGLRPHTQLWLKAEVDGTLWFDANSVGASLLASTPVKCGGIGCAYFVDGGSDVIKVGQVPAEEAGNGYLFGELGIGPEVYETAVQPVYKGRLNAATGRVVIGARYERQRFYRIRMERFDGDLESMPWRSAAQIQALRDLWQRCIGQRFVHGDLKLLNMLHKSTGNVVRLCDFDRTVVLPATTPSSEVASRVAEDWLFNLAWTKNETDRQHTEAQKYATGVAWATLQCVYVAVATAYARARDARSPLVQQLRDAKADALKLFKEAVALWHPTSDERTRFRGQLRQLASRSQHYHELSDAI